MEGRNVLRDAVMLLIAGAIGWWAHGANTAVRAASSSDAARVTSGMQFQFQDGALTLYNPENQTFYVYHGDIANGHMNCSFSIHVQKPGGALDRQNCAIGPAY